MNITSKSRYALKIMMDLADHPGEIVHRTEMARRQGIPLDYMDQILTRLRESKLIGSTRGRGGGYQLGRPPGEISALEIFSVVEDVFEPVQCLDGGAGCSAEHVCRSKDAWSVISGAIRQTLSGIILSDLVASKDGDRPHGGEPDALMQECRAPRRRSGAAHGGAALSDVASLIRK